MNRSLAQVRASAEKLPEPYRATALAYCAEAEETIRHYPGSEAQVLFDLCYAIESLKYNAGTEGTDGL